MQAFQRFRDALTPTLKTSQFVEKGMITPDEFVQAGDQLVYKCPTWTWASGDASCRKSYLPADKQFLVTRNVPCFRRAREVLDEVNVDNTICLTPEASLDHTTDKQLDNLNEWVEPCVIDDRSVEKSAKSIVHGNEPLTSAVREDHMDSIDDDESKNIKSMLKSLDIKAKSSDIKAKSSDIKAKSSDAKPKSSDAKPNSPNDKLQAHDKQVKEIADNDSSVAFNSKQAAKESADDDDEYCDMMSFGLEDDTLADMVVGHSASTGTARADTTTTNNAAAAAEIGASTEVGATESATSYSARSSTVNKLDERSTGGAIVSHVVHNLKSRVKTRTYDMSISYDNYHRTPRVYLFGYDEDHRPLQPEQIMEDVMQDYAQRTVTLEKHPHYADGSIQFASIHPCRHAQTMKRIVDAMLAGGKDEGLLRSRVDQYLFIFLKFVQSVVPTLDYDHTMEVDL